jgi:hypothetical protein
MYDEMRSERAKELFNFKDFAPIGRNVLVNFYPRALPWAIFSLPFQSAGFTYPLTHALGYLLSGKPFIS